MANPWDSSYQALGATGPGTQFKLKGGVYAMGAVAGTWGGGNVALQALLPDGVTFGPMYTAQGDANAQITSNSMISPLYLPPGQYRFNVTTATGAVAAYVAGIPF